MGKSKKGQPPKTRMYRGQRYDRFSSKPLGKNAAQAEAERLRTMGDQAHVKKFRTGFFVYVS